MKKYTQLLLIIMSIAIFSACNDEVKTPEDTYQINGKIAGTNEGYIFIKTRGDQGIIILDSALITEGTFNMTGHIAKNSFAFIVADAFKGGIPVFIENTTINVVINKDSIADTQISGTEAQKIYDNSKFEMSAYDDIWQGFYYNTFRYMTDEEKAKNESHLNTLYDSAQILKKSFVSDFIKNNADNYACAQVIIEQEQALGEDKMLESYNLLSNTALESLPGEQLTKRINIIKRTAIGQPLIDFTMNDTEGNPIKLSQVAKGKYLLVDFWAAWCSPCRAENPNVLANYNKYNDKGFDVLGVSFDEKKENWLKAVKDDALPWLQISDLKGWANAAGKLYGISSIPQNILLDPEGKIIAKNLRGEALGEKLEELFK